MLHLGDCLEVLKTLEANSVDSVVSDGPYELGFMSKAWDATGIVNRPDFWREVLRVMKPGAHLLNFGGTRTYHRMACAIEDAGFEIRDQIQWLYGSGFPKSHNIGNGFGTALKPANEPIVLARKPLEKGLTVAKNVEKWGCGALNIDQSRIGTDDKIAETSNRNIKGSNGLGHELGVRPRDTVYKQSTQGRWPANLLLDEESAQLLDLQSGQLSQCGGPKKTTHDKGMFGIGTPGAIYREENRGASRFFYVAKSSKKDRSSNGVVNNIHPTCKPTKLMEYLCKLITKPGGIILDPFMGSGSTGVAAKRLGFQFIGIEMNEEYLEIARRRIEANFLEDQMVFSE